VWYFPSHLPELNPVENCWNQFKNWYKYRFIETLDELTATLPDAFQSISEPDLLDYICS
ncbi:transposase, partial [Pseudomonas aeruginosa]|uniref:transposase n=1 Tax=Pseudomonas aeruginosa TaxID=287 RepID=UPI0034582771